MANPQTVKISIYSQAGELQTTAEGELKRLALWRGRWVRGGCYAVQEWTDGSARAPKTYGKDGEPVAVTESAARELVQDVPAHAVTPDMRVIGDHSGYDGFVTVWAPEPGAEPTPAAEKPRCPSETAARACVLDADHVLAQTDHLDSGATWPVTVAELRAAREAEGWEADLLAPGAPAHDDPRDTPELDTTPYAQMPLPAPEADAWPAGKTFGELTPAQRQAAIGHAAHALQDELTANAPAIGAVMDGAEDPARPRVLGEHCSQCFDSACTGQHAAAPAVEAPACSDQPEETCTDNGCPAHGPYDQAAEEAHAATLDGTAREGFYVTVIRNPGPRQRVGLLLGPCASKADAEERVTEGRRLAHDADPFTAFDSFGVTRVQMKPGAELPAGKLNERAADYDPANYVAELDTPSDGIGAYAERQANRRAWAAEHAAPAQPTDAELSARWMAERERQGLGSDFTGDPRSPLEVLEAGVITREEVTDLMTRDGILPAAEGQAADPEPEAG